MLRLDYVTSEGIGEVEWIGSCTVLVAIKDAKLAMNS